MARRRSNLPTIAMALGLATLTGPRPQAQTLGIFGWQLQPFCNVVTLTVIQQGGLYTVDGFDDQCGAPQRAPVVGLVTPNPDGTIGFGLHVVTVPGARAVHIDARVTLAALSGSWADSAGNSGTFAFGAATGGSPRPQPTIPAGMIAPGSITSAQLGAGAVTAANLAPGLIGTIAQTRVVGVCTGGQALRGVNADGTVTCTDIGTVVAGFGTSAGEYASLAIGSDGRPIISHRDGTYGLRVTHCGNPACSTNNRTYTVDSGVSTGQYSSIAIGTDGLPVISNQGPNTLRVIHCGDVACSAGNVSTTVDAQVNVVGAHSSIAIGSDGLPVISHQDVTTAALRVSHCGNVLCSAGNATVIVDDDAVNAVGTSSRVAVGADGNPVISHQMSGFYLRITHCGNVTCSAGNSSVTADGTPASPVGFRPDIAIGADGLAVVSHFNQITGALRVTHCGNAACTGGTTSVDADDPTDGVGQYSGIAIGADGLPVISHLNSTASAPRVTHCGNAACSSGNVSTTVDDLPTTISGYHTTIGVGSDGLPILAHSTLGTLRVFKCGTRTCQ